MSAQHDDAGRTPAGTSAGRSPAGRGPTLDDETLGALLGLAERTAAAAGHLLVAGRPAQVEVAATKTSPTDVVTEMDRASERLITERLRAERPQDGVLGEEGASSAGSSGVRWVVDPIDGTVNYLYGQPAWAVSIAAQVEGASVVGVVHAPALGCTWTAVRGKGAWRDGRRLRVNQQVPMDRALVGTGFGYEAARRAHQGEVLAGLIGAVRDVRRWGSCAIDLCFVADGRLDAYFERGPQAWDYAAGGLVATEAGARLGGLRGAPASPELVVAAPEPLFADLEAALSRLEADRD